jgi:hypothetical protein
VRRAAIIIATIVLFCTATHTVCAYTYTYYNKTDLSVRIDIQLYDDLNKGAEIAAHGSHIISTRSLIKSWTVDVFLDNKWQQALELTCDLLPGDHTFSIYVEEIGEGKRDWYVIKQ